MKICVLFLTLLFCIDKAKAQQSTCDTFTIKGYVILMATFNEKLKSFDTYYGFCYDSCVNFEKRLDNLISRYKEREKSQHALLLNIPNKDFSYIIQKINESFIPSAIEGLMVVNSICDNAKLKYLNDSLNFDFVGKRLFSLPNPSSYCLKVGINKHKPMVNIQKMTLKCILIKYKSFEQYNKKVLDNGRNAQPPLSFCSSPINYRVNLQEIKQASKKDGLYYVISPVYRVD